LEFPYRDWKFEFTGINRATLHINGRINEVKILIGEGYCQAIGFTDEIHQKEFSKWIPTAELFLVLR
jgi:hypothetical protein